MKTFVGFIISSIVVFAMGCILFKNFVLMCYNIGKKSDEQE